MRRREWQEKTRPGLDLNWSRKSPPIGLVAVLAYHYSTTLDDCEMLPMREITGQRILITGGSSGIGAALAQNLARQGARVIVSARRQDRLQAVVQNLQQEGLVAHMIPMDVRDPDQVTSSVTQAAQIFGGLDILINNAGIAYFGEVSSISRTSLKDLIDTNIYGVIYTTQSAASYLAESRGMVVNLSSTLSKRTLPLLTLYAGTKSMVNALSDGLRVELRPYAIHVLNYCAPETETELQDNTLHDSNHPLPSPRRRRAAPDVVARHIIRAIRQERREVVANAGFVWLARLMPNVVDAIAYRRIMLPYWRNASRNSGS